MLDVFWKSYVCSIYILCPGTSYVRYIYVLCTEIIQLINILPFCFCFFFFFCLFLTLKNYFTAWIFLSLPFVFSTWNDSGMISGFPDWSPAWLLVLMIHYDFVVFSCYLLFLLSYIFAVLTRSRQVKKLSYCYF